MISNKSFEALELETDFHHSQHISYIKEHETDGDCTGGELKFQEMSESYMPVFYTEYVEHLIPQH